MGFAHCQILILLVAVLVMVVAESSSFGNGIVGPGTDFAFPTCNGRVGDCIDDAEEMMLDSEANRRILAQARYISYDALKKNNVPCNRRGSSYYNCGSHQVVNPYARGCNRISMCARNTQ